MKSAAPLNEFLASLTNETNETPPMGAEARYALREQAGAQAASLLVGRIFDDIDELALPSGELAVELRCIDAPTIPLRKTMQRLLGGAFDKPGVESNIVVLFATSSNTGRHLEKLAEQIRRREDKTVCFYSMFSVDGKPRPWVLKPGMPMKMVKTVDDAVTTKIVIEEATPVVEADDGRVYIRLTAAGTTPPEGLVLLVPGAMSVSALRTVTELDHPNSSIVFITGPDENEEVAVLMNASNIF